MPFYALHRCKWLADGATTLSEMSEQLEFESKKLRQIEADGVRLDVPVEDDYAEFVTDDPEVAQKYEMLEPADDQEEFDGGLYGEENKGLVEDDD